MKHVLLCDDQKNLRKVLKGGILQLREDVEVHESEDGLNCLDFLKNHSCDLLFLDVEMPNLDGFETLQRIRQQPSLSDLKVVMVTAMDSEEDIGKGIEYEADGYITKPYNLDEVQEALEQHL